jgi:hypothetical protein
MQRYIHKIDYLDMSVHCGTLIAGVGVSSDDSDMLQARSANVSKSLLGCTHVRVTPCMHTCQGYVVYAHIRICTYIQDELQAFNVCTCLSADA